MINHRIGARKMFGLAVRAIALPAALLHRRAGAASGTEAVTLMPAHHRFRHRDRREAGPGGTTPCIAMPRSSVTATSLRVSNFSAAAAEDAHAEHRGAVTQP